MRWMLLCLALAACGGDDDATTPDAATDAGIPDAGHCRILIEIDGEQDCVQCGRIQPGSTTCLWTQDGEDMILPCVDCL